MKYYIIAGEASGDLHGSNLMKAIKKMDSSACFRFWGGDLMLAVDPTLVKHYKETAFMGVIPVVMNLNTILKNLDFCKKDVVSWQPDVLILIDYPGFNLKMAEFIHAKGIKVCYYISPKIWAWKQSRIKYIKRSVDKMLVIFPFETDFYAKFDYPVEYVGNPLLDSIAEYLPKACTLEELISRNKLNNKPIIALIPGSRKQEIKQILPLMMSVIEDFPGFQFVITGAPSIADELYNEILKGQDIPVIKNQTYDVIRNAHAALVTSGTATLETALLNTPQVVCYKFKGGSLVYNLGKMIFLKVSFISLVNLITGRESVKELIQQHLTRDALKIELDRITLNPIARKAMLDEYAGLQEIMGKPGASGKAAASINEWLHGNR